MEQGRCRGLDRASRQGGWERGQTKAGQGLHLAAEECHGGPVHPGVVGSAGHGCLLQGAGEEGGSVMRHHLWVPT